MAYIFDPKDLQEICKKNLSLPLEEKFEAITEALDRQFPGRIRLKEKMDLQRRGRFYGNANHTLRFDLGIPHSLWYTHRH